MDIRTLDRMVSRTQLTQLDKRVLRKARKAAMSGRADGPYLSNYAWSVVVDDKKFTFALRKDDDGDTA